MFENHGYNQVTANSGWQSILSTSYVLTNYWSLLHASQANYIAILAGSYWSCTSENMCYLGYSSVLDLMDKKGVSWKGYFEGYPGSSDGSCNLNGNGNYVRNHNPFMSFTTVTSDVSRCQKVVHANQFVQDLNSNSLPDFSFYVPDNYNNSHDKDLDYSSNYLNNWLNNWYYPYINTTWKDTLLMITWDEDGKDEYNHIVTCFKHPCLPTRTYNETYYDHYSVTKFLEDNWGLDSLGRNDTTANNFADQFVMTCGTTQPTTGGKETKTDTETEHRVETRGFLQLENSKSTDMLVLMLVGLAFIALPVFRFAWVAHQRRNKEDLEKNTLIRHYIHPNSVFASVATSYVQMNDDYY